MAAASLAGLSVSPEIHICETADSQYSPAVATGPNEYLVVWMEANTWGPQAIDGRRVSGDGIPRGSSNGFEITQLGGGQFPEKLAVAYGAGYGYLVVWQYFRGAPSGNDDDDVYARYVMPGQDSAAGGEFAIHTGGEHAQSDSAVACAPSGGCLVVEEEENLWGPPAPIDSEIRGRLVMPHRVYLPMVLKNYQ